MKLATWSDIGAATSAGTIAATIFCCLPFATSLIGAGVAAFGARLAPFQPYLIGLSLASLAYSFHEAYRPDPACVGEECRLPSSRRGRRIMVWVVGVFVVLFVTASWWADSVIYWML
jgi:hypothetical protein